MMQLSRLPVELLKELCRFFIEGEFIVGELDSRVQRGWSQYTLIRIANAGYLEHLLYFLRRDGKEASIDRYMLELVSSGREECIRYVAQTEYQRRCQVYLPGSVSADLCSEMVKEGFIQPSIQTAAESGNLELLKYLLPDKPHRGNIEDALVAAVNSNHFEVVDYLMDRVSDSNWIHRTYPQIHRSSEQAEQLVTVLLKKFTLDLLADHFTNWKIILALTKKGWKPTHEVLHYCWSDESIELVKLTLQQGHRYDTCCVEDIVDEYTIELKLLQLVLSNNSKLLGWQIWACANSEAQEWLTEHYPKQVLEALRSRLEELVTIDWKERDYEGLHAHTPEQLDLLLEYRNKISADPFRFAYSNLTQAQKAEYLKYKSAEEILDTLCSEN